MGRIIRNTVFSLLGLLSLLVGLIIFTIQPWVTPVPSTPPAPDPARLQAHVRELTETRYPRSFDQEKNLNAVADYIHADFVASGAKVAEQEVLVQGEKYRNIIARFGPAEGPILVIGAHYDSHGGQAMAAKKNIRFSKETHTPGADDNASGVAGLLELGRLLAQAKPTRAIELVAYTLEEPPHFETPHMGSAWHAASHDPKTHPIEMMISLEMIGYFSDAPNSQDYPVPGMEKFYSSTGNFIGVVGRLQDWRLTRQVKAHMLGASSLPVHSINTVTLVEGVDWSDQLNYWNKGIHAVMITDTAYNRNRQYHLAGDTWDRLDYKRIAQVVQGVYAFAMRK